MGRGFEPLQARVTGMRDWGIVLPGLTLFFGAGQADHGGYSSVVERQIVALDVVGSSPTILPLPFFLSGETRLRSAARAAVPTCDGV